MKVAAVMQATTFVANYVLNANMNFVSNVSNADTDIWEFKQTKVAELCTNISYK